MIEPVTRAARSYLFVPASRPDRFEKALHSGADAVIIDLEDAVPGADKVLARRNVEKWLAREHPVYVRVNGAETEWFADDVRCVAREGLRGVVVPKSESVEVLAKLAQQTAESVSLLPIIETAQGLWGVYELARAPRVERLAFGHIDFQRDVGIQGDEEELLYARSRIVLVSRVANLLPPVDGITATLDNSAKLQQDINRARRLGFGGKLCVHPQQVQLVNTGFLPPEEEIAWANRVVETADRTGGIAVRLGNEMIDTPIIERAREILRLHEEGQGKAE